MAPCSSFSVPGFQSFYPTSDLELKLPDLTLDCVFQKAQGSSCPSHSSCCSGMVWPPLPFHPVSLWSLTPHFLAVALLTLILPKRLIWTQWHQSNPRSNIQWFTLIGSFPRPVVSASEVCRTCQLFGTPSRASDWAS